MSSLICYFIKGFRRVWEEVAYLEIDGNALTEAGFHECNGPLGMSVEEVKVADAVASENWSCNGPVES